MSNTEIDEFITATKTKKPPYTLDREKMTITIDRRKKKTPADEKEIEMLIKAGYIPIQKRTDITKADMIRYVKRNYDEKELKLLESQLNTINEKNENDIKITFATIKSWFKNRYVYYPKGLNWSFGSSKSAKEKKERFITAFNKHKEELKKDGENQPIEPKETPKSQENDKQPPQHKNNNNNYNKNNNNNSNDNE